MPEKFVIPIFKVQDRIIFVSAICQQSELFFGYFDIFLQATPTDYISLWFILLSEMYHFSGKISLKQIAYDWIMTTPFSILASQP